MGKLLVKLGLWIQDVWCKFSCFYNSLVVKLIIKVDSCPNQVCTCKKWKIFLQKYNE
jgi:hypothetical protein